MPAFYLIIMISLIVVWFLLSGLYKPLGKYISKIIKDSVDTIKEVNDDNDNV